MFLASLMSALSACSVASSQLQQHGNIRLKVLVALICTVPTARSRYSGVSRGILVVMFLDHCVTYHLNRFYTSAARAVAVVHKTHVPPPPPAKKHKPWAGIILCIHYCCVSAIDKVADCFKKFQKFQFYRGKTYYDLQDVSIYICVCVYTRSNLYDHQK